MGNQVIPQRMIGLRLVWLIMTIGVLVSWASSASAADGLTGDAVDVARAAVEAWSHFAATGDLTMASEHFVVDGPQWEQFEAESVAWRDSTGSERLQLEILEDRIRRLDSATATVWLSIRASKPGFTSEVFGWDFDLVRDGGRWLVWTVVPAAEPTGPSEVPASEAPTASTTTTTTASDASVVDRRDADHEPPVAAAGSPAGTRIPVLSAWVVVVTLVGVAVAGYLAPRFDRGDQW